MNKLKIYFYLIILSLLAYPISCTEADDEESGTTDTPFIADTTLIKITSPAEYDSSDDSTEVDPNNSFTFNAPSAASTIYIGLFGDGTTFPDVSALSSSGDIVHSELDYGTTSDYDVTLFDGTVAINNLRQYTGTDTYSSTLFDDSTAWNKQYRFAIWAKDSGGNILWSSAARKIRFIDSAELPTYTEPFIDGTSLITINYPVEYVSGNSSTEIEAETNNPVENIDFNVPSGAKYIFVGIFGDGTTILQPDNIIVNGSIDESVFLAGGHSNLSTMTSLSSGTVLIQDLRLYSSSSHNFLTTELSDNSYSDILSKQFVWCVWALDSNGKLKWSSPLRKIRFEATP